MLQLVLEVKLYWCKGKLHRHDPRLQKFLEFVESAKDGVIYFSFGTIVDPSKLPDSIIEIFINVLKRVKQKVMWKWNSKNLPPLPDHVMVSDWFPQSDILGTYLYNICTYLTYYVIIIILRGEFS